MHIVSLERATMCWLRILFTAWIQLAITSFPEIDGRVPAEGAIPFAGKVGLCKNAFPETADHPEAARLFFFVNSIYLVSTPLPGKDYHWTKDPRVRGSKGNGVQESQGSKGHVKHVWVLLP